MTTDPVSQIHTLSSSEAALVDKIKQILDESAVESTPYNWGHRYGSERLKSATDELKAEISKKHTVYGIGVSKIGQGVRMHKDTMIIALEPSILTTKTGSEITLNNGSYVYVFGDPLLSSSSGRDYIDAIVVALSR